MQRKKAKTPDLPIEAVRQHSDNVKGSSVHTEMHNIANDTETAENEAEDAKLTWDAHSRVTQAYRSMEKGQPKW